MDYKVINTSTLATNTYIIFNRELKESIVIDPGDSFEIDAIIRQNECELKYILLTHCHFDHANGCKELKELTNCKVYMAKVEENFIHSIKNLAIIAGTTFNKFTPDVLLEGGEKLNLCGYDIDVIATPGHTIGSMTYLFDKENIMFVGDTLFSGSYGRTDFPTGNFGELMDSMAKLFKYDKDYTLLAGHGDKTTLFSEKSNNGF